MSLGDFRRKQTHNATPLLLAHIASYAAIAMHACETRLDSCGREAVVSLVNIPVVVTVLMISGGPKRASPDSLGILEKAT